MVNGWLRKPGGRQELSGGLVEDPPADGLGRCATRLHDGHWEEAAEASPDVREWLDGWPQPRPHGH